MTAVGSALVAHWLAIAALLLVLGALLFATLSSAGYPRIFAAVLGAIAILHPAFADPTTGPISASFALMVYAIAVSALAFERRQDARRTILLGSSLAGAQLVNPICGLLSAVSVPLVLRNVWASGQSARTVGQIVSLLFLPALVAVLLTYVWIAQHQSSSFWSPENGARLLDGFESIVRSAIAMAPLAIWLVANRKAGGDCETIGALCAVLAATGTIDGFLGIRTAPDATSAVGPLAVVALITSDRKGQTITSALLLTMSSIAACWLPIDRIARFLGV